MAVCSRRCICVGEKKGKRRKHSLGGEVVQLEGFAVVNLKVHESKLEPRLGAKKENVKINDIIKAESIGFNSQGVRSKREKA